MKKQRQWDTLSVILKNILLLSLCLSFNHCSKILYKLLEEDGNTDTVPSITGQVVYDCDNDDDPLVVCTNRQYINAGGTIFAINSVEDVQTNETSESLVQLAIYNDGTVSALTTLLNQSAPIRALAADDTLVVFDAFDNCDETPGITSFQVYEVADDGSLTNYSVNIPPVVDSSQGFFPLGIVDNTLIGIGSLSGIGNTYILAITFEKDATTTVSNLAGVDDNDNENTDFDDFTGNWESYATLNSSCLFQDKIFESPYFTQSDGLIGFVLKNDEQSPREFYWLNIEGGLLNTGGRQSLSAEAASVNAIAGAGIYINISDLQWDFYHQSNSGDEAIISDRTENFASNIVRIADRLFQANGNKYTEIDITDFSELITYYTFDNKPTGFDGFTIDGTIYTFLSGLLYKTTIKD